MSKKDWREKYRSLFSFEGASLQKRRKNPVVMALRTHLFPYRTQKLSSIASMVLGGRPPGRVDRCRIISIRKRKHSRIAQSAEHLTVNQREPSPTACSARRKEGEDAPQHSELSHESDENELMLQAGPLVEPDCLRCKEEGGRGCAATLRIKSRT